MSGVVLSTRRLPEPFDSLREDFEVRVLGSAAGELELAAEIPGVDALICLVDDAVTAAVIQAADRLKIVASYAVGVDQIDLEAAKKRGVIVTNTPDVLNECVADTALAEHGDDSWEERVVRPRENREPNGVDILLHRGGDDHLRGLVETGVDDLTAGIAEGAGDDFGATVVAIEAGLGDDNFEFAFLGHGGSKYTVICPRLSVVSGPRLKAPAHLGDRRTSASTRVNW